MTRNKRHKYKKKDSLYKKPEAQGHRTLFAPEASGEDKSSVGSEDNSLSEYTLRPEAKADRFVSLWSKEVRPMKKYRGFRDMINTMGAGESYASVKMMYKYYVNNVGWDEEKFSFVLDKILETSSVLSHAGFKRFEHLYEHGRVKSNDRNSGATSTMYNQEENQTKIEDVLDAWERLERM